MSQTVFELVKAGNQLPAKLEDLVPLRFMGQAAVDFYRTKVKLMQKLDTAEAQKKQTVSDGQDVGEVLFAIEAKIGTLWEETPPMSKEGYSRKGGRTAGAGSGRSTEGRERAFEGHGISASSARQSAKIADYPEKVEAEMDRARREDDLPSKKAVLDAIAAEEEKAWEKAPAAVERKKAELNKDWHTLEEWGELSDEERHNALSFVYQSSPMNEVNENIEWAEWSWNPVTGCLHDCPYCYARDYAARFYPQKFEPSLHYSRLYAPDNTSVKKSPKYSSVGARNVFVCSMADLFGKWVPKEWIESVLAAVARNPQWTFLMLTKFPIRMAEFTYPENVWLGTSVDRQHMVERAEKAFATVRSSGFEGVTWLSCEPMMERLTFTGLEPFDWVVMGGASASSQTPEYRPPFEDIIHLHQQAREAHCMVYQKTNLIPGMSDDQRIREYPN